MRATGRIQWSPGPLELVLAATPDAPVRIAYLGLTPTDPFPGLQPLVEVLVLGEGHALANSRNTNTAVGTRLRYAGHTTHTDDGWHVLRVRQQDPQTRLEATSVFRTRPDVPAVRTWTEIHNAGTTPAVLQMVSSFAATAPGGDDAVLMRARNDWCAESRWHTIALRGQDGLADINSDFHRHDGRGSLVTAVRSTWSSGDFLPVGVLAAGDTAWGWQVEHNGAWRWEIDARRDGRNAYGIVVSGPTDGDHQWLSRLEPGDTGYAGALAALTRQRRALRRPRPADDALPLIFNDYMNTLMGDPTTERLLPLIDAAARAGAEYFCVDAGWYDDGGHWWDSVGEWLPSTRRFPDGGLRRVLDHVRDRGMRPGLWLEPEVVGVRSPVTQQLPAEAFMSRGGQRVVEHSRYLLDLRHPAAREHLDSVVDRLVNDYGVAYFKLDYNVTPGAGTDRAAMQAGDGLLAHNRAHLAWLDGVLARHPDVVFENCAAGAMRCDYAMLSRLDLQSTSDQQDFRLYPPIAAAAPAAMLPEQAGNWAYPQPGMTPEELACTMVTGLAGRLYLSGHLDRMSDDEFRLVTAATDLHKRIRAELAVAEPFWPLGLPGWTDDAVALGLRTKTSIILAIWWRGAEPAELSLPIPAYPVAAVRTEYPVELHDWRPRWDPDTARLTVSPGAGPTARLLRIEGTPATRPASPSRSA